MAGLYVHVPFCAAICHYCNFTRGLLDEAVKARYVRAVVADICLLYTSDAADDDLV